MKVSDADVSAENKIKIEESGVAQAFWVSDYALREDHFGMVFTGYILVQEDGLYIFSSRSDDACKLFIHDELVVNQEKGYSTPFSSPSRGI